MPSPHTEEHELPCLEAVLAGTLALMTGYSQAMQAELDPGQRLHLGQKIGDNLALLVDQPSLSTPLQSVCPNLKHFQHCLFRSSLAIPSLAVSSH